MVLMKENVEANDYSWLDQVGNFFNPGAEWVSIPNKANSPLDVRNRLGEPKALKILPTTRFRIADDFGSDESNFSNVTIESVEEGQEEKFLVDPADLASVMVPNDLVIFLTKELDIRRFQVACDNLASDAAEIGNYYRELAASMPAPEGEKEVAVDEESTEIPIEQAASLGNRRLRSSERLAATHYARNVLVQREEDEGHNNAHRDLMDKIGSRFVGGRLAGTETEDLDHKKLIEKIGPNFTDGKLARLPKDISVPADEPKLTVETTEDVPGQPAMAELSRNGSADLDLSKPAEVPGTMENGRLAESQPVVAKAEMPEEGSDGVENLVSKVEPAIPQTEGQSSEVSAKPQFESTVPVQPQVEVSQTVAEQPAQQNSVDTGQTAQQPAQQISDSAPVPDQVAATITQEDLGLAENQKRRSFGSVLELFKRVPKAKDPDTGSFGDFARAAAERATNEQKAA